ETALEGKLPGFHKQVQRTQPLTKIRWLKWAAAASVAGILLWSSYFFFANTPSEKLFAQYYQPDPGLPTLMGISDNYVFENAMVSYKTGDYKKAIVDWQQLLQENMDNDTLQYFIGS